MEAMQVQIFQASGAAEIGGLQKQINNWLGQPYWGVSHTDIAMCEVGDEGGDRFQHLVVMIWYRGPNHAENELKSGVQSRGC